MDWEKLKRLYLRTAVICAFFAVFVEKMVRAEQEGEERHCYECTGFTCMQNPGDPNLYPGRVKCHEVMDYCATHVRYTPNNGTLQAGRGLRETDYSPTSATRSCAKVWLGNTCRRDWLGTPEITCITTCERDFCNCDTRSPPAAMFDHEGRVLHEAPPGAAYSVSDTLSCRHMAGVPGFTLGEGVRLDDDYALYNDYEARRRLTSRTGVTSSRAGQSRSGCRRNGVKRRRCGSVRISALNKPALLLGTLIVRLIKVL